MKATNVSAQHQHHGHSQEKEICIFCKKLLKARYAKHKDGWTCSHTCDDAQKAKEKAESSSAISPTIVHHAARTIYDRQ